MHDKFTSRGIEFEALDNGRWRAMSRREPDTTYLCDVAENFKNGRCTCWPYVKRQGRTWHELEHGIIKAWPETMKMECEHLEALYIYIGKQLAHKLIE